MLTSKQRASLRACANKMETIIQVGKDGINDNLIAQTDSALEARELIKLRVLETAPLSSREAAFELAEATNSESVQIIGARFVLFRRNKDKAKYDYLLK
ncbi:MAG: YhbY family RNA-binding protein [Clostridia bacterium]|nr:YhbY family RNA-binding protein [Clostridia bacterium]